MGGLLNKYTKLIFHDAEKWLNNGEDKSKYCCGPKTIGTKSVDEIINQKDHQDIYHEWDETESEPVERCCQHLQEETYGRINEAEDESHDEGCHKTIELDTWNQIRSSKNSYSR